MAAAVSVTSMALTERPRATNVAACATLAPVSVTVTPPSAPAAIALATAAAASAAVNCATVPVTFDRTVPLVSASIVLNCATVRL